jgi:predicted RNA binding protein YcfA (HicA-like mRNA interferase family)
VSDQLPEISGKRLIKALEQHGWYVKRIRGSHHVLRHPEIPAAPRPAHGCERDLTRQLERPRAVQPAPARTGQLDLDLEPARLRDAHGRCRN